MAALVIVPTYNEAENLTRLIPAVLQHPDTHLLVVDDASPDGTGATAEALRGRYDDRLHVLHRPGKEGLGRAYIAGFAWALERDYDCVFEMDADLSHDPACLPAMRVLLQDHDVVLGSRYIRGGGTVGWPFHRRVLSRGGSLYARTILNLPVHDLTGGFKGFRRRVLQELDFARIRSNGYAFQIEVTYICHRKGFRIAEYPITFREREHGRSKLSRRIVLEAVWAVWRLRLQPVSRALQRWGALPGRAPS